MNDYRFTQEKERERDFYASLQYETYFPHVREHFSRKEKGFSVSGEYFLSLEESLRHMMIVGKTGVGKSTCFIVPTCATVDYATHVIHDPSGELYLILHEDFERRGYENWIINFSSPQKSIRWNPLSQIRRKSDRIDLVNMLVEYRNKSSDGSNQHWLDKATALITVLLNLMDLLPPKDQTLGVAYDLLQKTKDNYKNVLDLFQNKCADKRDLFALESMVKDKTTEVSNIYSTAIRALFEFSKESEEIYEITSANNITLKDLRKKRVAFFVQSSSNGSHRQGKPISLLFEQIWSMGMEDLPGEDELPIFFEIDEAGSQSLDIKSLAGKIDKSRKHLLALMLCFQSRAQLQGAFHHSLAQTIEDNCFTKIFVGAHNGITAEYIEKEIGNCKELGTEIIRPRQPREIIRTWPNETVLILKDGVPAVLTESRPYYLQRRYAHLPQ